MTLTELNKQYQELLEQTLSKLEGVFEIEDSDDYVTCNFSAGSFEHCISEELLREAAEKDQERINKKHGTEFDLCVSENGCGYWNVEVSVDVYKTELDVFASVFAPDGAFEVWETLDAVAAAITVGDLLNEDTICERLDDWASGYDTPRDIINYIHQWHTLNRISGEEAIDGVRKICDTISQYGNAEQILNIPGHEQFGELINELETFETLKAA